MTKTLKLLLFIGLALFLGSTPGHILLGIIAEKNLGTEAFASLYLTKSMNTLYRTRPVLSLMLGD